MLSSSAVAPVVSQVPYVPFSSDGVSNILTLCFLTQRRAGSYGAKVGLVEASYRLGGTCVNVGM
jgi:hypothetical protein